MPAPARSASHRLILLVLLAAPLALVALGRVLTPDPRGYGTHEQFGFRPCFPMAQWGVPCPLCGVTTSVAHAVRGRALVALRVQPLGPVLLALALGGGVWALGLHVRGRDLAVELGGLLWPRGTILLLALAGLAWLYKLMAGAVGP